MQLQIECNHSPIVDQSCILCKESFSSAKARVIVCNDLGNSFGDLCPTCLLQGPNWIWQELRTQSKTHPKAEIGYTLL